MYILQQIKSILENILNNFNFSTENVLYLLVFILVGNILLAANRKIEFSILIFIIFSSILFILLFILNKLELNIFINKGISRANFFGYSSKNEMYSIIIYLFLSIIIFFPILLVIYKNNINKNYTFNKVNKEYLKKTYKDLIILSAILFGSLMIMPDLLGNRSQLFNWNANPSNWDVQNLLTWDELYISGLIPMKDFWYPYGNLIFTEAFPVSGRLLLWVFQCGYIVLSSILILNLDKSRNLWIVFINIIICIYLLQNDFWGIVRYGVPTAVIGLIIFYILNPNFIQRFTLLITFFLTLAPWLGGSVVSFQILLLITSIVVLSLFKITFKINFQFKYILNKNTIPYLTSLLMFFIYTSLNGTITEELREIFNSSQILEKSSYPMDFINIFIEKPLLAICVFILMPVILSSTLFMIFYLKEENFQTGMILFVFGIAACFSLYKWSSRGDLNDIRSIVILQILIFMTFILKIVEIKRLDVFIIITAFIVFSWFASNIDIKSKFIVLNKNISFETFHTILNEKNYLKKRQNVHRDFKEVNGLEELNNYLLTNKLLPFYSPTDIGYLNALNLQKPYYYISSYDSSTVIANLKILKLLKTNMPKSIIVDKKSIYFDSIHISIRLPEVMKWIVNNYELKKEIGEYVIFSKKNEIKKLSLDEWNSVLGKVDFGNIPYMIKERTCTEVNCEEYIKIKLQKKKDFCYVNFYLDFQKVEYFFPIKYDREYAIFPMSKTWSYNNQIRIDSISCAESFQIIKVNSDDKFF